MKIRWMMVVAGVIGLSVFGSAACSDESMTGPSFGDLEFTPSFENIGNDRTIELVLTNAGSVELGPILVGNDLPKRVDNPNLICSTITATATPSSVTSLAPGGEIVIQVDIDTSAADAECQPEQYDLDMFAAVDNQVLGGATVRFNYAGS
jgi:hypothetical protein